MKGVILKKNFKVDCILKTRDRKKREVTCWLPLEDVVVALWGVSTTAFCGIWITLLPPPLLLVVVDVETLCGVGTWKVITFL